jgi:hypothetical protein
MAKNRTLRQAQCRLFLQKQKTTPKSGLVINKKFNTGTKQGIFKSESNITSISILKIGQQKTTRKSGLMV